MKITGNRISLNEDELRKIIGKTIEEGLYDYNDEYDEDYEDEGPTPEEEYKNDYKNSENYDPQKVSREDLIEFCKGNDFLFVYESPYFETRARAANTDSLKYNIIKDLYNSTLTPTHDVDDLILPKVYLDEDYVTVFKVSDMPDEKDYYVVYEQAK